jgi:hypothetical protein
MQSIHRKNIYCIPIERTKSEIGQQNTTSTCKTSYNILSLLFAMMQLPMMFLLACILSVTPSNALRNDNYIAGRLLQQPTPTPEPQNDEPHLDDDSLTETFTHPVSDYYTNPYFTGNDDEDDNGSGKAILEPDPTSPKLSTMTIVWISAGMSIVVLLSLCILLGTVNRKRNQQRVHESMRDTMTAATTGSTTPAPRWGHHHHHHNSNSHDNVEMAMRPSKSVERNQQSRHLCDSLSNDRSETDSTTSSEDV